MATHRHPLRTAIKIALIGAALLLLTAIFLRWAATQGFGHRLVEAQIEKAAFQGQSVRLEGLQGDVLGDFTAEQLAISDAKGVWLRARDVSVAWRPRDLLSRKLIVRSVIIDEATILLRPDFLPSKPGARRLNAVDIQSLKISRITAEPALAGRAAAASASASARIMNGEGKVSAQLRPLEAADGDVADVSLVWSQTSPLAGRVHAHGPAKGLIAGLVGLTIDAAPEIKADFVRNAEGKGVTGEVRVSADATPVLNVSGEWAKDALRATGEIQLTAFQSTRTLAERVGDTATFALKPATANRLAVDAVARWISVQAELPFDFAKLKADIKDVSVAFQSKAVQRVTGQTTFDAAEVRGQGVLSYSNAQLTYEGRLEADQAQMDVASVRRLQGPVRIDWMKETRRADVRATLAAVSISAREKSVQAFVNGDGAIDFEGQYEAEEKRFNLRKAKARLASGDYTAQGSYQLRGTIALEGRYDARLKAPFPAETTSGRWRAEGKGRITTARLQGEAKGLRNLSTYVNGKDGEYDVRLRKLGKTWRLEAGDVRAPGLAAKLSGEWIDGALRGTVEAKLREIVIQEATLEDVTVHTNLVQSETDWKHEGTLQAGTITYRGHTVQTVSMRTKGRVQGASAFASDISGTMVWRGAPWTVGAQLTRDGDAWSASGLEFSREGLRVAGDLTGNLSAPFAVRGELAGTMSRASGLPFSGKVSLNAAERPGQIRFQADGEWQTETQALPLNMQGTLQAETDFSAFTLEGQVISADRKLASARPLQITREGKFWRLKGPLKATAGEALEADIDALWTGNRIKASYIARARGGVTAEGHAEAPWPLEQTSIIRIDARGKGRAENLWPLIAPAQTRLSGALAFDMRFEGPRGDLHPSGALSLTDGRFEHLEAGLGLRDVTIEGVASGNQITFEKLSAKGVRGGTASGSGVMSLDGTQDVTITLNALQPLQRKDAGGVFSGSLKLSRRDARTIVGGDIRVERAQLKSDRFNQKQYVTMNVRFKDAVEPDKKQASRAGLPLRLDIRLRADRQIEITGRTFETEWSGDVRLRGTLAAPVFEGNAELVRGYVEVAGRRFQFADSRVDFDGPLNKARLSLSAERDTADLTAIAQIQGELGKPEVSFSSDPALPEDEVLSRVLFGRAPSSLGRFDALQLAAGAAELTRGRGFGVFDQLESALGVDQLDAGVDETGAAFVSTGTYITEDVYADVRTNGRGVPRVTVEWTPERNIAVGTSFGASEEPRFTVKWRTDLGETETRETGQATPAEPAEIPANTISK